MLNLRIGFVICFVALAWPAGAATVFEVTSPYHHIRVYDHDGLRTLSFDGSTETRMSLRDPLKGHFEYTEYFHMPWLWCDEVKSVLMIGLGGGSTQRAYQHYYPGVSIDTVELDPVVVDVAKKYFYIKESPRLDIHISDGRVFLRRSQNKYDVILMDAYTANRYGSFIPHSLATKEFFVLASEHLSEEGVLAYNVIGTVHNSDADVVGAIYKTMNSVFPRLYLFPAISSQNVVIIGTKSDKEQNPGILNRRASELVQQGRITLPGFTERLRTIRLAPPQSVNVSPILTDDFAPVDGLLRVGR